MLVFRLVEMEEKRNWNVRKLRRVNCGAKRYSNRKFAIVAMEAQSALTNLILFPFRSFLGQLSLGNKEKLNYS